MWKMMLIGTATLAVAGSSLVYAQQRFNPPEPSRPVPRWQFTPDDLAAFADARIAALRAGLRLTPEQEKIWPAFEEGYRGLAKLRAERLTAWRERRQQQRSGDVVEEMQRRADAMSRSATAFKQFSDAAVPLYRSLDDAQKRRFNILVQFLRPNPHLAATLMQRGGVGPGPGFAPRGEFEQAPDRGFDRRRFGDRDEDDRRERRFDRDERRRFGERELDDRERRLERQRRRERTRDRDDDGPSEL